MKLLSTLFLPARAFSSASAFASLVPSGIAMASPRTMLDGTSAEIKASREAAPMTDSMRASSALSGPMWRAMNSAAFSSSASGVGAVSDMTEFQAMGQQDFRRTAGVVWTQPQRRRRRDAVGAARGSEREGRDQ